MTEDCGGLWFKTTPCLGVFAETVRACNLNLFLRLQMWSMRTFAIATIISILSFCGTVYIYISAKELTSLHSITELKHSLSDFSVEKDSYLIQVYVFIGQSQILWHSSGKSRELHSSGRSCKASQNELGTLQRSRPRSNSSFHCSFSSVLFLLQSLAKM